MSDLAAVRRAYLVLYRMALVQDPAGLGLAVRAIHEPLPGTPLPADFPYREQLARAGYCAREDLHEADAEELEVCGGLSRRQANEVLARLV